MQHHNSSVVNSQSWGTLAREMALILGGSLLVAFLAQVELPMWPVPITGQTFGVLLLGLFLGRHAALSMVAYWLEGAAGLPVFAGGAGGFAHAVGPTGGYLLGFIVAAFVVGWLAEKGWCKRMETAVLVLLLGSILIYLFGIPWLAQFTGWQKVWSLGILPFIPGDVLKVLAAAIIGTRRLVGSES